MNSKLFTENMQMNLSDPSAFHSFQIQTTTACSSACIFCPHRLTWGRKPVMYMSDDLIDNILNQMKDFNIYRISPYLQNEPLCDPRIFNILKKINAKLKFNHICFSTNAIALSKHKCDKLVDTIKEMPHQIRLSFHGVSKETYEKNTGTNFEISLKNAIYFLRASQENGLNTEVRALGSKKGPVDVGAYDFDKNAFLDFWKEICYKENIEFVENMFFYSFYNNRSNNADFKIESNIVRNNLNNFYCTRVDKCFHFLNNGRMVLCCNDYNEEVIMGNILLNNIHEIIASEDYRTVNKKVCGEMESELDFLCKRCSSPFYPWW